MKCWVTHHFVVLKSRIVGLACALFLGSVIVEGVERIESAHS